MYCGTNFEFIRLHPNQNIMPYLSTRKCLYAFIFMGTLFSHSNLLSQSFISAGFGAVIPAGQPSRFLSGEEFNDPPAAFNLNLETAMFNNPLLGFGGSFFISSNSDNIRIMLGPYLNIPLGRTLNIQAKFLLGWLNGSNSRGIGLLTYTGYHGDASYTLYLPVTGYAAGLAVKHRLNDFLAFGFTFDYTTELTGTVFDNPVPPANRHMKFIYAGLNLALVLH
jgi:hypothetical protein